MNKNQFREAVDGLGFSADVLLDGGQLMLSSSNLFGLAYDFDSNTLVVSFLNGSSYQYTSVPEQEVLQLLGAGSHGSYFHYNIRLSYPYTRL